jgi:hypothetical protein
MLARGPRCYDPYLIWEALKMLEDGTIWLIVGFAFGMLGSWFLWPFVTLEGAKLIWIKIGRR